MKAEKASRPVNGPPVGMGEGSAGTPSSWRVAKLSEVASIQTGLAKGKVLRGEVVDVPYLRVANVQDGFVDLSEMKNITVEASLVERFRLRPGDVLFTEGGDIDKLGRGCVWRGQVDPCLHQNHIFVARTCPDLLPEYLALYAASSRGRAYFLDCAKRTTNLASINSTQLKALPLSIPPISVQRSIAAAVGAAEESTAGAVESLSRLGRLRRALHLELCRSGTRPDAPRTAGPFGQMPAHWSSARLRDLVVPVRRPCTLDPNRDYVEIGIRSHGRGIFLKERIKGSLLGNKRVFHVDQGCLALNIVFAWEGAVAVTGASELGTIASHRFPMLMPVKEKATAGFLRHLLLSPPGLRLLGVASPGGAGRNRTLNQGALLDAVVPCPPVTEQEEVSAALDALDEWIALEKGVVAARRGFRLALADALLAGEIGVSE